MQMHISVSSRPRLPLKKTEIVSSKRDSNAFGSGESTKSAGDKQGREEVDHIWSTQSTRNMHVMIVGGGDSALEAAISISEEEGSMVTLSYRSGAFSRAKEKNRQRVEQAVEKGRLNVVYNSNVKEVEEKYKLSCKGDNSRDTDKRIQINKGAESIKVCKGIVPSRKSCYSDIVHRKKHHINTNK